MGDPVPGAITWIAGGLFVATIAAGPLALDGGGVAGPGSRALRAPAVREATIEPVSIKR
jgi:hypothetical protein